MSNISALEPGQNVEKKLRELQCRLKSLAVEGTIFEDVEEIVKSELNALGCLLLSEFLALCEERSRKGLEKIEKHRGVRFRLKPAQQRRLLTQFGTLSYERSYLREVVAPGSKAQGFHPLDAELGLLSDRISTSVLSASVRLATSVSYSEARDVLSRFLPQVPSTEVIQKSVMGYGARTQQWFEQLPPPDDDGEVLVIQIDSKGAPMAKDAELEKRRGKRRSREQSASARHRGRVNRQRHPKRERLKKGDKSKNAKMGTMVVIYSLRREGEQLLGPLNKRCYASFASKQHAVQYARREATKRGFPPGTLKVVQVVTDGDRDLSSAKYIPKHFPDAIHTIDIMHVIERLWETSASLHKEGTDQCKKWALQQRAYLYSGRVDQVIRELKKCLQRIPKTGPGNKYRRDKVAAALRYIEEREHMMNYLELTEQDLEIGTGPVEGAIKHIMHKRFDHGGMRWIKERAEALLQLRCIHENGHWESFTSWVHQNLRKDALAAFTNLRLQRAEPEPLPGLLFA